MHRRLITVASSLVAAVLTGCSAPNSLQTGLISSHYEGMAKASYSTKDQPYSDKAPMSASAAANAWLHDTRMEMDFIGGTRMSVELDYFIDKLRQAGAIVETAFPTDTVIYSGPTLPQHHRAIDMLKVVSETLQLKYVASYNLHGKPVVRLFKANQQIGPSPMDLHPTGVLTAIDIRPQETLVSVVTRLAENKGYQNALFDFTAAAGAPHVAESTLSGTIQGDGLLGLTDLIVDAFGPRVGALAFYEAKAADGHVLVVTDRPFERWQDLRVFEVKSSTLSENAARLAGFYGWNLAGAQAWRLDKDYSIVAPYKIVVSGVEQAYDRLLENYPVKATLVRSTESVFFTTRNMPVLSAQRGYR